MLTINIPQCYLIAKNYDVKITKFKGTEYKGDTQWIAEWYYTQYQPFADNVIFHIRGDFHETYPNPPHLSIKIEYPDGNETGWLHVSLDTYGKGYLQNLPIAGNKRRSIKKRKQHKQHKQHKITKREKNKKVKKTRRKKTRNKK